MSEKRYFPTTYVGVQEEEGHKMNRGSKVKVWVRTRPTASFAQDMIDLQPDGKTINIHCKRDEKQGVVNNQILDWSFKMDGILHNASQDQVFSTVAHDMITGALNGYNGTLMCYGQTGAGKTFTITGATENYAHRGLIPRALQQLYREIEDRPEQAINIRVSYLEIYNESMFDLLSTLPDSFSSMQSSGLIVADDENGVYVKGLSTHLAQNEEDALNLLFEGETNRAIASHTLNNNSSRSHCIFTVYIEARSRVHSTAKYTTSKLNFVDLAGSERLGKTRSEGKTQQEAMYINKSLTFLEQTIIALADKKRDHIPFRQTKLTHCLKDSIGGNCNTLLIANVWGESKQIEETVSTLRFATRMMCVKNEPALNEYYDPVIMVKKLEKEIRSLKQELAMHDTLTNRSLVSYEPLSEQQKYEMKQQVRKYVEGALDEIDIVNIRQIQGVFEAFKEISSQMEKDVEAQLREKYTLIDKTDPDAIAAAQKEEVPEKTQNEPPVTGRRGGKFRKSGAKSVSDKSPEPPPVSPISKSPTKKVIKELPPTTALSSESSIHSDEAGVNISDDGNLVGETDGANFGVGVALKGNRAEASAVIAARKREKRKSVRDSRGSPVSKNVTSPVTSGKGRDQIDTPITPGPDKRDEEKEVETPSVTTIKQQTANGRPSTPPSRQQAFEEFKLERGSEINRILGENKDILIKKKKDYANLARQINTIKVDIDTARDSLETLKSEREAEGSTYNEDGEAIISEEEFLQIKKLKDLKQAYRSDYDDLKALKSEVQYCQKLVDSCRQKLVQEFDTWYTDCFLGGEDKQTSYQAGWGVRAGTVYNPNGMLEDEQEKFDRLQAQVLMEDPDSASYQNARMRTERRKIYDAAMTQTQPKRKPGTPTKIIRRGPPPTLLEVSQ